MRVVEPHLVRDLIARAVLGDAPGDGQLGDVVLLPHQRAAIPLLRRTLRRLGGVLLADEVGFGKTYTALGVLAAYRHPLILAPAALRSMWRDALQRTGLSALVDSYERLARSAPAPDVRFDLIVLDEAHYLRNAATRRYAAAAVLARGAHVLALSATPLHNRGSDLVALFALFLGSRTRELSDDLLAQLIVRRHADDSQEAPVLPTVGPLRWVDIRAEPDVLQAIVALPPPLPPADGGAAHALATLSLIRSWCSSDAALLGAIRRRLQEAVALEHALTQSRYPTRDELARWVGTDGALQLAFPELLPEHASSRRITGLLRRVRAHATALRALRDRFTACSSNWTRDMARFDALARVLAAHGRERVLVFSHSADTVHAAFRALRNVARVACLTSRGGRIASGAVTRQELLRSFDPRSRRHLQPTPAADLESSLLPARSPDRDGSRPPACSADRDGCRDPLRINVLIATDVLSEGVDLHSASVVVHLDLPWTPARLEQRLGRIRRLGSPHHHVSQFAIGPPADAAELAVVVARLRQKADLSRRMVGLTGSGAGEFVLPALGLPAGVIPPPPADVMESVRKTLARWRMPSRDASTRASTDRASLPVCGAVQSVSSGHFLAVVEESEGPVLVAGTPESLSTNSRDVLAHLGRFDDDGLDPGLPPFGLAESIVGRLTTWIDQRHAIDRALTALGTDTAAHRAVLRRIDSAVPSSRRAHRALIAALAREARRAVLSSVGVGMESLLSTAATDFEPPADVGTGVARWLRRLIDVLAPYHEDRAARARDEAGHIIAVLLSASHKR